MHSLQQHKGTFVLDNNIDFIEIDGGTAFELDIPSLNGAWVEARVGGG
jgi:hypothetical protein